MKNAHSTLRALAAFAAIVAGPGVAAAQNATPPKPAPIQIPRLQDDLAPKLDGKLDDELWKGAAKIEKFYETVFGDNREPSVATRAYVAYDSKYFYVGVFA